MIRRWLITTWLALLATGALVACLFWILARYLVGAA